MNSMAWDGPSARNPRRYVFAVAAALLLVFASTSGPALGRGAHKTSARTVFRVAGALTTARQDLIANTFRQNTKPLHTFLGAITAVTVDSKGDVFFGEIYPLEQARSGPDCDVRELVKASNSIRIIAGLGISPRPAGSDQALRKRIGGCAALAITHNGSQLYVVDNYRDEVDRVSLRNGDISVVAGGGRCAYPDVGDGRVATQACLSQPQGLAVGTRGVVLISDSGDNRIREVTASGRIRTIAGTGRQGYSGDGGLATRARLNYPTQLAVDHSAVIFVADTGNGRIRLIGRGVIGTIVGGGHCQIARLRFCRHARRAQVILPTGLAIDRRDDIFVSNTTRVFEMSSRTLSLKLVAGSGKTARTGQEVRRQANPLPADTADIYTLGITTTKDGRLLLGDYYQCAIREVSRNLR